MLGVGQKAPDFSLPDQSGEELTLSDLRGGTVVLYFYPRADTRCRIGSNARVLTKGVDEMITDYGKADVELVEKIASELGPDWLELPGIGGTEKSIVILGR